MTGCQKDLPVSAPTPSSHLLRFFTSPGSPVNSTVVSWHPAVSRAKMFKILQLGFDFFNFARTSRMPCKISKGEVAGPQVTEALNNCAHSIAYKLGSSRCNSTGYTWNAKRGEWPEKDLNRRRVRTVIRFSTGDSVQWTKKDLYVVLLAMMCSLKPGQGIHGFSKCILDWISICAITASITHIEGNKTLHFSYCSSGRVQLCVLFKVNFIIQWPNWFLALS